MTVLSVWNKFILWVTLVLYVSKKANAVLVNKTRAVCVFELKDTLCCNRPCQLGDGPCGNGQCAAIGGRRQAFHRARVAVHACLEKGYSLAINTDERFECKQQKKQCVEKDLSYLREIGFPEDILEKSAVPLQFPRWSNAELRGRRWSAGGGNPTRRADAMRNIAWYYQVPEDCVILFDPDQTHVDDTIRAGYPSQRISKLSSWLAEKPCGIDDKELKEGLSQIEHCKYSSFLSRKSHESTPRAPSHLTMYTRQQNNATAKRFHDAFDFQASLG